jgi:hypothetical protein
MPRAEKRKYPVPEDVDPVEWDAMDDNEKRDFLEDDAIPNDEPEKKPKKTKTEGPTPRTKGRGRSTKSDVDQDGFAILDGKPAIFKSRALAPPDKVKEFGKMMESKVKADFPWILKELADFPLDREALKMSSTDSHRLFPTLINKMGELSREEISFDDSNIFARTVKGHMIRRGEQTREQEIRALEVKREFWEYLRKLAKKNIEVYERKLEGNKPGEMDPWVKDFDRLEGEAKLRFLGGLTRKVFVMMNDFRKEALAVTQAKDKAWKQLYIEKEKLIQDITDRLIAKFEGEFKRGEIPQEQKYISEDTPREDAQEIAKPEKRTIKGKSVASKTLPTASTSTQISEPIGNHSPPISNTEENTQEIAETGKNTIKGKSVASKTLPKASTSTEISEPTGNHSSPTSEAGESTRENSPTTLSEPTMEPVPPNPKVPETVPSQIHHEPGNFQNFMPTGNMPWSAMGYGNPYMYPFHPMMFGGPHNQSNTQQQGFPPLYFQQFSPPTFNQQPPPPPGSGI